MKYSFDRKRLSLAKPLPEIQTPTPRTSLPFTFTRTKKLSHSVLEPSSQRYLTQPFQYNQDKYMANISQIKRLKEELKRITERKKKIANPEYFVSVEEDVAAWEKSITLVKEQLEALRKQGNLRVKKIDSGEKKQRELIKSIQQQLKNRNNLNQQTEDCQKQIEYFKQKNELLKKQIEQIQNQESNTAYLKKLKQIQLIQMQSCILDSKLQNRCQLLQQQSKRVDLQIFQHQTELSRCENSLFESMTTLNELTLLLYSRTPESNHITELQQEDQNQFIS